MNDFTETILYGLLQCIVAAIIGIIVGGLLSLPIDGYLWQVFHKDFYLWQVFELVGAGIGIGLRIIFMYKEWKEEQKEEHDAREREKLSRLQHYREEQHRYYQQMLQLGEHSITLFESMPTHLNTAEEWLDQADVDYAEGAFSPFWSSIENAAKRLAHFDGAIDQIKDNSSEFTGLVPKYRGTPPQFPLTLPSVEKLRVGTTTAKRMQATVREAQRNYQFATIYERRKTNEILIAGFTNLGYALDYMTSQITDSIANLTSSVDGMSSTLNDSMRTIHSQMRDSADAASHRHLEVMTDAREGAARESRVIAMLDNIQRRRRPTL